MPSSEAARRAAQIANQKRWGPFIPTEVVREIIAPTVDKLGSEGLARQAGTSAKRIWEIMNLKTEVTSAFVVDKLVTKGLGEPHLWHEHPVLSTVF